MTRMEILDHQLKKSLTSDDYAKTTKDDKSFVLAKATQIVDGYVHYKSGSELDFVICDIALDMILTENINKVNTKPMEVPSNIASIKEGDTIITFNQDDDTGNASKRSASEMDAYYINTYADALNRYRKLKR